MLDPAKTDESTRIGLHSGSDVKNLVSKLEGDQPKNLFIALRSKPMFKLMFPDPSTETHLLCIFFHSLIQPLQRKKGLLMS